MMQQRAVPKSIAARYPATIGLHLTKQLKCQLLRWGSSFREMSSRSKAAF
jgi:hypothetical protein